MKEVTRIRIAKTSYDIEIGAKKHLETYIQALSLYAEDENVLEDIEIRITELLTERSITANDVIGEDDVTALRAILGEPQAFSGEGDIAIGDDESPSVSDQRRKWYRDIDRAVLGGVLSGLARYFAVNALWVRLAFIALLFVSLGLVALIYVVLWIILPAAVTVTEKLQARGETVTLAAIRRQSEGDEGVVSTAERIRRRRRFAGMLTGTIGILGALIAAAATVTGAVLLSRYAYVPPFFDDLPLVLSLFIASGVLFTLLWILIAYSGFKARLFPKVLVIAIGTIVLGIASFGAGISIISHNEWQRRQSIQESIMDRAVTLPVDFEQTKKLVIDTNWVTVDYRVADQRSAVLTSIPGMKVEIKTVGTETKISEVSNLREAYETGPLLIIYGPQLDEVVNEAGITYYASRNTQPIKLNAEKGQIRLSGIYSDVSLEFGENSFVDAEAASVMNVSGIMKPSSALTLGTVASLNLTLPTACSSNAQATVDVVSVVDGKVTINDQVQLLKSESKNCSEVRVDDYDYSNSRYNQ